MVVEFIKKRDGREVPFKKGKITIAVAKAILKVKKEEGEIDERILSDIIEKVNNSSIAVADTYSNNQLVDDLVQVAIRYNYDNEESVRKITGVLGEMRYAETVADKVVTKLGELEEYTPDVERVQDIVEEVLIEKGNKKVAKEYILYRNKRSQAREMNSKLMKTFSELTFVDASNAEVKRENANVDGDSSMGNMLRYGSEAAKQFNLDYLISDEVANAHKNGDIHIHDLDFYSLTETCVQIDLEKLFDGGFNTGHGFLREPGEIRSYAALACIAIQSNQNDMHKRVYA